MRARLAHCWTLSREHSGMHIVGEPEKGLLWKSVNRGMPTSHQCSSVFLTAPATFTWLAYGSWCLTGDVFSVCFFPLFYSLITSFSKHALFTWTVPGAGLGGETIRIKGLGLAHRSVGSQMHEGFIPGVRCWMFGWHMGLCQDQRGNACNSLFSQFRYMQGKHLYVTQNKIKEDSVLIGWD